MLFPSAAVIAQAPVLPTVPVPMGMTGGERKVLPRCGHGTFPWTRHFP